MFSVNPTVIKNGLSISWKWLIKAAPTIGVIFGVGMMAGAAVKTGVETPKMKPKLDELNDNPDLSHKEYLKKKAYVLVYHLGLPAFMLLGGASMILFSYKIKYAQAAMATAALAMKTDEAEKFEQKIIEKYGEKDYEKIKDDLAKDEVKAHPVNYSTVYNTGHGNTLFYDPIGHGYFWSDQDYILKQEQKANNEMVHVRWGMRKASMSYDTWREYLDLPPLDGTYEDHGETRTACDLAIGKDIGWLNRPIETRITVMLLPDHTPCHILGYTRTGGPTLHPNIDDSNGEDASRADWEMDDDETDMRTRGGVPW